MGMNTKSIFEKGESGTLIVPPRIQQSLTGVVHIFAIHPRYAATYEDGTVEEAVLPGSADVKALENFFTLTEAIQAASGRPSQP